MVSMQSRIASAIAKEVSIDQILDAVDYSNVDSYIASDFALKVVNFIKLIHAPDGTENVTPPVHYKVLDSFVTDAEAVANMMHRGFAKSTLMMYLILYLAQTGELPNFGKVDFIIYISDSMENGVATMRAALDDIWDRSEYLQKALPYKKTTEGKWVFKNAKGKKLTIKGYGAKSGIRGTRENGKRPQIAIIDDVLSDDDAKSPTICKNISDTLSGAVDYALHPTQRKIFWEGTPFHADDPLYKAIQSGQYEVNLYPVCEKFPVEQSEFRGSWEDRFTYSSISKQYLKALGEGKLTQFYREMMLRITSEEDRLIADTEILEYNRDLVMRNMSNFNFYITTDFAVTAKETADLSFISVLAVSSNRDIFWVDGWKGQENFDAVVNQLFNFVGLYRPMGVGIESSGQQRGLISTVQREMHIRNIYFNLLKSHGSKEVGIKSSQDKFQRFQLAVPYFTNHKFYLPSDEYKNAARDELKHELQLASKTGFMSRWDDGLDTVSMIPQTELMYPSSNSYSYRDGDVDNVYYRDHNDESVSSLASYLG